MDLLKLSLATYLIAVTIARLHGPFGLAERLRHAVYSRSTEDHWLATGISCPICLSPYVAAALLLVPGPVINWLAVAGGASAIFKLAHR